ncbi:MAG TPA: hypothetical protein ENI51_04960, partial [Candidatus Atribacteria bacterium]|nr:hypothetical protein [Candidatus Atribacteria bacterium]
EGINNFILAYLSGEKIETGGGISEGMSGSPVYIDGRLVGAVSYAWEMSKHNLCLLTPIQEMLKIFDFQSKSEHSLFGKYQFNKSVYPTISSVMVSGLKDRPFNLLSNSLKKYNVKPVQGPYGLKEINLQEVGEVPSQRIEAGSAIGIQLSRGDVNITSIGTVTYREGNKILALGHPFLKKGEVSFLLSLVYIYHSLPNIIMPFKLGAPLNLVGKVTQDREAGILGEINSFPRIISLKVNVDSLNSESSFQMGVQLIDDPELLEPLVSAITVQAIDNAINRIGEGTAHIVIELKGIREGQYLIRKNMFYSSIDIAIQAISEIPEIIDLIINNYFEAVNLSQINIDIKIDDEKKIGKIEEVILEKSSLKPGDYLRARVRIRPFRQDLIEKTLTIKLPSDIPLGEALLLVNGGGDSGNQQKNQISVNNKKIYKSLDDIFEDITDRPRGNQIIGEIIVYSDKLISEEKTQEVISKNAPKKKDGLKDLLVSKIETDMVIEGYLEIP